MKPILTAALLLVITVSIQAQTNLSVKAGVNLLTARAYYNGQKQSVSFVPGAIIGLQASTMFENNLYFSPFVGYSGRGFEIKESATGGKRRVMIHYAHLATLFSCHIHAGKSNLLIVNVGPTASLALAGREKLALNGSSTSTGIKFSTSKGYGLFDFGAHAGLSYQFNRLQVGAAYDYGFVNINNNEETDKRNIRNRALSVSVAYILRSWK